MDRPCGFAQRLDRVVPDAHRAPVIVRRHINRLHVILDLPTTAINRRPVRVTQQHRAVVDDLADRRDMAELHIAMRLERHDRTDFGAAAALELTLCLVPPCMRITIDGDARLLASIRHALQVRRQFIAATCQAVASLLREGAFRHGRGGKKRRCQSE